MKQYTVHPSARGFILIRKETEQKSIPFFGSGCAVDVAWNGT